MKKYFLIVSALIAIALFCEERSNVMHFGVDQGLSQGSVFDMCQDDQGLLWIGTADGLNCFDGYNFKVFKGRTDDSAHSMPVHIRALFKGKQDLWITTSVNMQLYRMDLVTQKTKVVYSGSNAGPVKELLVFREEADTVWLLSSGNGIIKINWRTGAVLKEYDAVTNTFPSQNLVSYDSLTNTLWYGQYNGRGLASFDIDSEKISSRSFTNPVTNRPQEITSVARANNHRLWLGSDRCILKYDPALDTFARFEVPTTPDVTDHVCTLFENGDQLWCGTERGNVYLFDELTKTFARKHAADPGEGLASYRIIKFFLDRTQNLWIGTDPGGLFKIDTKDKPFHHVQRDPLTENSLKSNFVKCFLEKDGLVYVGLYNNCVSVFNRQTNTFAYLRGFEQTPDYLPTVSCMTTDNAGHIWMSTSQGPAYLLPGQEFLTRPQLAQADSTILRSCNTVFFQNDTTLLVGGDTGMYRLQMHSDGAHLTYYHLHTQFEKYCQDDQGNLWAASAMGLFYSEGGDPANLHLIVSDFGRVKCIIQTEDHSIWVGTENALLLMDRKTLKVARSYTEGNGMPNNFVYGIIEDRSRQLWISTNKGIGRFNPVTQTFRNYTVSDGLQSNEFNTGAYYQTSSGEIFFGGVNGYNHFFPDGIQDNPFPPKCVITGFSVFDRKLETDTSISYRRSVVLDYTQDNILIEYAGLEFSDPSKNKYKYRLAGLDTNWIDAGKERFARFVNLDPGEYTFQLIACNNDGRWSADPLELKISITPPFWETTSFIIGTVLIGLLLVVAGIRLYLRRQIKIRTRELQLEQGARIHAIFETEEKERKRIAGELHDGLGQLLSTAKLNVSGIGENLDAKDQVLYHNSLQLLDQACEEVRTISHNMMPGALIRMGLIVAVNELILKINDTEKLSVEYETEIQERFSETIEITAYRIIQEALNNMVKHSGAKNIRLRIARRDDLLEITIADDGTGFEVSTMKESKGLGWKNMFSRVETLKGTIDVKSIPGKGTDIFISIPLTQP